MGKIIHNFCHYCQNTKQSDKEIRECADPDCPVYDNRINGRDTGRLIREYCIYCVAGLESASNDYHPLVEARDCVETGCIFYPYRMGKLNHSGKKGNMEALKRYREGVKTLV